MPATAGPAALPLSRSIGFAQRSPRAQSHEESPRTGRRRQSLPQRRSRLSPGRSAPRLAPPRPLRALRDLCANQKATFPPLPGRQSSSRSGPTAKSDSHRFHPKSDSHRFHPVGIRSWPAQFISPRPATQSLPFSAREAAKPKRIYAGLAVVVSGSGLAGFSPFASSRLRVNPIAAGPAAQAPAAQTARRARSPGTGISDCQSGARHVPGTCLAPSFAGTKFSRAWHHGFRRHHVFRAAE